MADRTQSSIDIAADPDQIMEVIADFESYPEWVDSMKSADVVSTKDGRAERVRMVLAHPLISDDYTLAYTWAEDKVSWTLVQGTLLKAMNGSYELEPRGSTTRVTYTLAVDLTMPMLGMIKRKAEKTIIDGALKGLKKRVQG